MFLQYLDQPRLKVVINDDVIAETEYIHVEGLYPNPSVLVLYQLAAMTFLHSPTKSFMKLHYFTVV